MKGTESVQTSQKQALWIPGSALRAAPE